MPMIPPKEAITKARKLIALFVVILVCRVFSWGSEGPEGIMPEINDWLKGKKVIAIQQSSVGAGGGYGGFLQRTYLTIIAETI